MMLLEPKQAWSLAKQGKLPYMEAVKVYLRMRDQLPNKLLKKLKPDEVLSLPDDIFPKASFDLDSKFVRRRFPKEQSPGLSKTYRLVSQHKQQLSFREILQRTLVLLENEGFEIWYSLAGHAWVGLIRSPTREEREALKEKFPYLGGDASGFKYESWLHIRAEGKFQGQLARDMILGHWLGFKRKKGNSRKQHTGHCGRPQFLPLSRSCEYDG